MKIKTKKHGLIFECRNKRDATIVTEVCDKQVYRKPKLGFEPEMYETWLDLGGNIGAFTVWAAAIYRCNVVVVEPCLDNIRLINKNLKLNGVHAEVIRGFAGSTGDGQTEVAFNADTAGRSGKFGKGQKESVDNVSVNHLIAEHRPTGLKIDIEGGEFDLLDEGLDIDNVRAIAMEYHFRFDKSCSTARKRLMPMIRKYKNKRVSKQLLHGSEWQGWIDDLCYFWN
jgi:FkbM family methyltransferase